MMRYPGNLHSLLTVLCFIHTHTYIRCQSNTTTAATNITTAATNITTTAATNITTAAIGQDTTVSANNAVWLIVGVVCGVVIVLITVIGGCVALWFHKSKRVHPHSDTETIYTESESYTRPTTASYIHFDPEEEAMSKPVPMTPFELRKLYVETFPFTKWRKSFDGHLRPHMGLSFVHPNLYARTKFEEQSFRQQIQSFELSDSLTVRSNTVSRLTRPVITAMSNLEPLPEIPSNSSEARHPTTSRTSNYVTSARSDRSNVRRSVLQGDDVEL